jgi:hypothetical protein
MSNAGKITWHGWQIHDFPKGHFISVPKVADELADQKKCDTTSGLGSNTLILGKIEQRRKGKHFCWKTLFTIMNESDSFLILTVLCILKHEMFLFVGYGF